MIVEDEHVSRVHLRFFVQDGKRLVEDMGSRWGTKLNGESLTDPKPLKHGDEIRIGKSTVHYICYWDILPEGPKHQSAAAAAPLGEPVPAPAAPPAPAPPVAPPVAEKPKQDAPTAESKPPVAAKVEAKVDPKIEAAKKAQAAAKMNPPAAVEAPEPSAAAVWPDKPVAKRNYLGFDVGGAIVIILLVVAGLVYLGYHLLHSR